MKYLKIVIGVFIIIAVLITCRIVFLSGRGDKSSTCRDYYASMENPPAIASAWCNDGEYFTWKSTLPENKEFEALNIFTRFIGDKSKPAILIIHGFPTSSYDFYEMIDFLKDDYYICLLDTPGYGFSDKPRDGFKYSMFDDAKLIDYFIREKAKIDNFTILTHDKGDSVGLALLQLYQSYDKRPYTISHHIITNGSIYLPLAGITTGQKLMLNPVTGPVITSLITGERMASGMAKLIYTPELNPDEIAGLASTLDYQDGTGVLHETIKYLNERKEYEVTWLETLARSDIPTALVWADLDPVAKPAIADYAWKNYLQNRKTPSSYWRIPCANHYLQNDQPEMLAMLLRSVINNTPEPDWTGFDCRPSLQR